MITIIGTRDEEIQISEAYVTDDGSAVTVSNVLSAEEDDSEYFCVAFCQYGIVTVSDEGVWADFEVMNPECTEEDLCRLGEKVSQTVGFPLIRVRGEADRVAVQRRDGKFILWLEEGRTIDRVIFCGGAAFLCEGERLVAIEAANSPSEQVKDGDLEH